MLQFGPAAVSNLRLLRHAGDRQLSRQILFGKGAHPRQPALRLEILLDIGHADLLAGRVFLQYGHRAFPEGHAGLADKD